MEPTTVTTLVMIALTALVFALTFRAYFGSWEPQVRRAQPQTYSDAEIEAALQQMRRGIEAYERGERPL